MIIILVISGLNLIIASGVWLLFSGRITGKLARFTETLGINSTQFISFSEQIATSSQSLAEGATEQAAGLEETSSSLEEMASMTKQNADNAQQANTLSADARKAADTGNESMGRMNTAILDIQKSSDETAKIIKVIDEIAFQTNLLALNAAVEAARAGEAGKGFAVVAEEVRNLAMRSAEAAKDTSAMIEESVKNSHNGVEIAGEVSKILEQIVEGIGKTTDLVGEIAAASQEQSQGIDQVNTAVNQMDKVTQSNAANAEESASASEELSAQAEQMNGIVEELSALVGGSSQANTSRPARTLKTSDHTFHQIASGTSQTHSTQSTAEQSIPLGGKGDFDGFNK
jgi:methyl-accepting chemotaxis protein